MIKYCGNCGRVLEEGTSYCGNCGQKRGDSIIANIPLKQPSEIPLPFVPIEVSDYNVVYQKCISKSVYNLNLVLIWLAVILNLSLYFFGSHQIQEIIYLGAFAVAFFWISPSGTRRVYNKSHGSRTASNIAFLICTWFNLIGWVICWFYENW